MPKELAATIKQHVQTLIPEVKAIYLFGSQGSNTSRENSDVDIAILPPEPLAAIERWELSQQLATELNIDVDLIDLLTASTVLRMEIITTGQRLYSCNQSAETFEMTTLSMYQHLQDERAGLVADFLKRIQSNG